MTSCSASSASAFPEAPPSPSVAIAATRSITPAPVRPWQGSGPLDAKTASRCSIGQPGRSDGPLLGPSGAPFYPSTRPSTSSRRRISSGCCANPAINQKSGKSSSTAIQKGTLSTPDYNTTGLPALPQDPGGVAYGQQVIGGEDGTGGPG